MKTTHADKACAMLKRAGYAAGGGIGGFGAMMRHGHGRINPDVPAGYARGGGTKGGKGGKGHTHVNVIVAPQGGGGPRPAAAPVMPVARPPIAAAPAAGPPVAAMPARPVMPAGPPPAGMGMPPGGGAVGPGLPPGGPPPGVIRKRGGSVPHMTAGGGGAKGRLQKIKAYGP